jgi:hypothetical protein
MINDLNLETVTYYQSKSNNHINKSYYKEHSLSIRQFLINSLHRRLLE